LAVLFTANFLWDILAYLAWTLSSTVVEINPLQRKLMGVKEYGKLINVRGYGKLTGVCKYDKLINVKEHRQIPVPCKDFYLHPDP
jgi:hypothetical protein